jgi:uncharacterized membrane protein
VSDITQDTATVPAWRRIVLPASVILNLFLLAVIGGYLVHARYHRMAMGPPLTRVLARAEAILGPKDAAAFGTVMRRDASKFATSSQQLREAREQLEAQISAEPFNPTATRQALSATQGAWDRFIDQFSDTLVEGLAQVSPEGRRKLMAETQFGAPVTPERSP